MTSIHFELLNHECRDVYNELNERSCGGCREKIKNDTIVEVLCVCYFGEAACPNGRPQHCNPLMLC
uniref:Uncharacterized protein n=1 Tax=Romanomermis culicivorax TaxID=13658 RepID=A0A915K8E7_ROMCU